MTYNSCSYVLFHKIKLKFEYDLKFLINEIIYRLVNLLLCFMLNLKLFLIKYL